MASPAVRGAVVFQPAGDTSGASPSFDVLDDVVRLADTRGLLAVRVPRGAETVAVAGHIERRGAQTGREVVRGASARVESAWRDVATRLGLQAVPHDPLDAARAIVSRAAARRTLVVIPMLHASPWDDAVCDCVGQSVATSEALFVIVVPSNVQIRATGANWFDIDSRLDGASLDRWWEGVAAEARSKHESDDLAALDAWRVAAVATTPSQAARVDALPGLALELLLHVRVAGRAWPVDSLNELGDERALDRLANDALVEVRDGLVVPCGAGAAPVDVQSISPETLGTVAEALTRTYPDDAWGLARAAELLAAADEADQAEGSMRRSLELAADASSRSELWRRWTEAVGTLGPESRARQRIRAAELALELGDVDVALDWAEGASGAEPSFDAAFVLGRATLARGDLVSAKAALARAAALAPDGSAKLRVRVAVGELHFANGDFDRALELAESVIGESADSSVRLGARNLVGKVLLARGAWKEAGEHFAADACDASMTGEVVNELRARVNRAIALMSSGSYDEARPMLLEVLDDAEDRAELRAVGFALSNLAVLATERHDYRTALELSERTITVRRRLGERLGYARDVINLVELRLRLGLVGPAEEALRFARQSLGPGAPSSRLTELALAAARVHLACGRSLDADREARAALRTATQSTDGEKLGECHRLASRIALDDGVLARAEAELEAAESYSTTPYEAGELAILRALVARANGVLEPELGNRAVIAARESGDEELAREAHTLAAEIALGAGDRERAASHVEAACMLRDDVLRNVGPELSEFYLGRRDLVHLASFERTRPVEEEAPDSVTPRGKRSGDIRAMYVGRHPLVQALIGQVKKVGRTDATVLIHGESGTGKELIAEGIHADSPRSSGPLVKVNCAALVETLLLSELFGHEKGAFTGAQTRKRGRFERANGGTLFLDEIGDISERTQVALLRVLEERTIERVGGSGSIKVDVRIVCATNRDLRGMVDRGEFREDLYYRLSGIGLEVPPLRERLGDLPLLCTALLDRVAGDRGEKPKRLSKDAMEILVRHSWPGNVRELENALRAASLFADSDIIGVQDLLEHVEALKKLAAEPSSIPSLLHMDVSAPASSNAQGSPNSSLGIPTIPPPTPVEPASGAAYREIREGNVSLADVKRQIERECISRALSETKGNITRAAAVLGMKRPRLSQLVKQYGLLTDREAE